MTKTYLIYPTKESRSFLNLYLWDRLVDLSLNGPMLDGEYCNQQETPLAWDAGFDVEVDENGNKKFVIVGGVGPSGYGEVRIELPLNDRTREFYRFFIDPVKDEDVGVILETLAEFGYDVEVAD